MIDVIPAIIPKSFEDLKDKMSLVNNLVPIVQVDICDGNFVPSKSWPYIGDAEEDFKRMTLEDEGFPFWETLDFEAHLMVMNPETVAEDYIKAGAKRIIMHVESSPNLLNFIQDLRKKYGYFADSMISIEIGIAIDIPTPNEALDVFLTPDGEGRTLIDLVQFMGIDKVGFQDQNFDEAVLGKISDLREKYPGTIISVDGGVHFDTAPDLVEAGVNRMVAGSTIYESENIKEAIEKLQNS